MSVQSTKCTALVVAHVKEEMYALRNSLPILIHGGPAKSMPVTADSLEGFTRSIGCGASICWPRVFIIILHGKPVCKTLLTVWRVLRIQNSLRSRDNIICTAKWFSLSGVCKMSKLVKWWAPSSSRWCCWSLFRSAHFSRPPKLMSPFSKNGLKRTLLNHPCRGKFFWRKCSSAVKAYTWTTFTQYIWRSRKAQ